MDLDPNAKRGAKSITVNSRPTTTERHIIAIDSGVAIVVQDHSANLPQAPTVSLASKMFVCGILI